MHDMQSWKRDAYPLNLLRHGCSTTRVHPSGLSEGTSRSSYRLTKAHVTHRVRRWAPRYLHGFGTAWCGCSRWSTQTAPLSRFFLKAALYKLFVLRCTERHAEAGVVNQPSPRGRLRHTTCLLMCASVRTRRRPRQLPLLYQ